MTRVGTAEAIATRMTDRRAGIKTKSGMEERIRKTKNLVRVITQLPERSTLNWCTYDSIQNSTLQRARMRYMI
jgi:hypothetical protein